VGRVSRPEDEETRTGALALAPAPDRGRPQGGSRVSEPPPLAWGPYRLAAPEGWSVSSSQKATELQAPDGSAVVLLFTPRPRVRRPRAELAALFRAVFGRDAAGRNVRIPTGGPTRVVARGPRTPDARAVFVVDAPGACCLGLAVGAEPERRLASVIATLVDPGYPHTGYVE
jgi:hypothetical protein